MHAVKQQDLSISELKVQRDALTVLILVQSFSDKTLPYQIGCLASEVNRGFGSLQRSLRQNSKAFLWACAQRFERTHQRKPTMLDLIGFVS